MTSGCHEYLILDNVLIEKVRLWEKYYQSLFDMMAFSRKKYVERKLNVITYFHSTLGFVLHHLWSEF